MWTWDAWVNRESAGEEADALGFRPTTLRMLPEAGLSSGFDPGSSSSGWRRWRQAPAEDDSAFARPSWVVGKAAPRLTVSEDPELCILEMEGGQEFPRKPEQGRRWFSASPQKGRGAERTWSLAWGWMLMGDRAVEVGMGAEGGRED